MAVVLHRSLEADVGDALRDGPVVLAVSLPVKVFGWLLLGLPGCSVAVSRVRGHRTPSAPGWAVEARNSRGAASLAIGRICVRASRWCSQLTQPVREIRLIAPSAK